MSYGFYVACPTCGAEKGPYTQAMTLGSRHCECGTVFTIDFENESAGEIVKS